MLPELFLKEIKNQTKNNFLFLIKMAKKYEADLSQILERPNGNGETVFAIAYGLFCDDDSIIKCFLDNNVAINYVTWEFTLPCPRPSHAYWFILNGINLKIIAQNGKSPLMFLEDSNRETSKSFSPKLEKMINFLPNSAYFSIHEQICAKNCPVRVPIR